MSLSFSLYFFLARARAEWPLPSLSLLSVWAAPAASLLLFALSFFPVLSACACVFVWNERTRSLFFNDNLLLFLSSLFVRKFRNFWTRAKKKSIFYVRKKRETERTRERKKKKKTAERHFRVWHTNLYICFIINKRARAHKQTKQNK